MGLPLWKRVLNTTQLKNYYSEPPAGLQWRSNTLFILSTVAVGLFTDLFLYGLIVPVLPFMLENRAGVSPEYTQRYTSAMLAAYAGASVFFSPIAGVLADKVSTRQAPFLLGLTSLLAATILLFVGKTVGILLFARVLQGISSGFVWTIGLALCIETVGPENLGKTIGSMFSFISAGSIWAPFLGGVLYKKVGYGGVMGVAFAVLAVDFLMRVIMIEKKVARRYGLDDSKDASDDHEQQEDHQDQQDENEDSGENDERQPLLATFEETGEDYKLSEDQPWIVRQIPILPCLANPALLTALLQALVQAAVTGSFDATVPTVSRELFDFDSLKAGVLFLPIGLVDLIFSPLAGWTVDRYGTKPASVICNAFLVPILVLLRLPQAGGIDQIILYVILLALAGIGLSGTGAPSIVEAGTVVQKYHENNKKLFGETGPYAQLYGLNSCLYNAGLTLGPELAGELKERIGYGNMNIVLAAICAVTAVLSFLYVGGRPKILGRKRR